MKPINKAFEHEASSAYGRNYKTMRRRYQITQLDVGKELPHYLGNCDKGKYCMGLNCKNNKRILRTHIGSVIEVIVDQGHEPHPNNFNGNHSWYFVD